jgi:predicted ATP-grasp superfamily ATP-dependent carboligase
MELAKLILQVINTLAVLIGTYVAIRGINAWKKQMRGSTDYQLARRYLKAAYKVREAIREARSSSIHVEEMVAANKENEMNTNNLMDKKNTRAVYSVRWEKVRDAMIDLQVELMEAEVSWGKEVVSVNEILKKIANTLFVNIKMYLDHGTGYADMSIISNYEPEDKFSSEIDEAINKIEIFLRPHLK